MSERMADEVELARRKILVEGASDLMLGVCVATELVYRTSELVLTNKHEIAELFRRALKAETDGSVTPWVPLFKKIMTEYLQKMEEEAHVTG